MRVFLTGATGYVGSNLALQLLRKPEIKELTLLVRNQEKAIRLLQQLHPFRDRIKFACGDLEYAASLQLDYDVIIHAAAVRIPESNNSPEVAIQVNLLSTLNIIQQAQRSGAGFFIFLSTQAVYDFKNNSLPVGEYGLVKPEGIYAFTKFAVEQWLQNKVPKNSMRWAALRLSKVYGLGLNTPWDQLVGKFCLEASRGGQIKVWNGDNEYDLVHIRDVTDFVINLIYQPDGIWNQVYNVGGGMLCTVDQLAETCRSAAVELGLTPPQIIHKQDPNAEEQHFFLDIAKALDELGWKPRVSLHQGVKELISAAARGSGG